jgi:hypothetical protein
MAQVIPHSAQIRSLRATRGATCPGADFFHVHTLSRAWPDSGRSCDRSHVKMDDPVFRKEVVVMIQNGWSPENRGAVVKNWRCTVPYGCKLEDLLAILDDHAPAKANAVALQRRRVEHGLLSVVSCADYPSKMVAPIYSPVAAVVWTLRTSISLLRCLSMPSTVRRHQRLRQGVGGFPQSPPRREHRAAAAGCCL